MFSILLVDDEELALVTLRNALPYKEFGFSDIVSTTSAVDALELLQNRRFDACFVDIRMPDINGLDLIATAKQYAPETQFVIVSGYSDFSYAKQAIKYDVVDYCLKPIGTEDCIPVLEKLYNRIIDNRITNDPSFASRLLKETTFCQKFLSSLPLNNTNCMQLTLLIVFSADLLKVISQAKNFFPAYILFLGENEAFFIWHGCYDPDYFSSLQNKCEDSALFIYDIIPPKADIFQSSFNRMRIMCHASKNKTGIIKVPSVHEETVTYFSNILSFIETNYARHLTLQELAQEFNINYSYLSQLFKKALGTSFAEHLTSVRLKHASELLSNTYTPITHIAEYVGYNDYHYFCNTFKQYFSMTPSQYRNASRKEETDT